MDILNAHSPTDYFIPPAYGRDGVLKRSVQERAAINDQLVKVFPNPADYLVTIELQEMLPTQESCTLVITDAKGLEIQRKLLNPSERQFVINTEQWPTGFYAFNLIIPNSTIEINGKFEVVH